MTRRWEPGDHEQPQHRTRFSHGDPAPQRPGAGGRRTGSSSILAKAELYDPALGPGQRRDNLNTARLNHTATLLPNGLVLVARDRIVVSMLLRSRNCMIRCRGTGVPPAASTPHAIHTATLLSNGMVSAAGGQDGNCLSERGAVHPVRGNWSATGNLNTARLDQTATCWPTASCWWQAERIVVSMLSRARNV